MRTLGRARRVSSAHIREPAEQMLLVALGGDTFEGGLTSYSG